MNHSSSHSYWWESGSDDVAQDMFQMFRRIDEEQSYRILSNKNNMSLYSKRSAAALFGGNMVQPDMSDRLNISLVKSIIDTALAHQATTKPVPMYLTSKGSHTMQRRSEQLTKFIKGQFYALDHYHKSMMVYLHAAILGTGFMKFYREGGRIMSEHVHTNEMVVDDNEARYGDPRTLYQHKAIPREQLRRNPMFKKILGELDHAGIVRETEDNADSLSDKVSVIEAWRLPSYEGAKDGRHVVGIENAAAVDERWQWGDFPFAVFRPSKAPEGYWGIGMAEELQGLQREYTNTLRKIQEHANVVSSSVWFKKSEAASMARPSNKVGSKNVYEDVPPTVLQLATIPPELLQHKRELREEAFNTIGVSQLQAASQVPRGVKSGEAMKNLHDIGAKRFQHIGQEWEHFHVRESAERILDLAREIEEEGGGSLKVLCQGDRDVEEIKFSDVSIEKDKYIVKAWPVSLFPDTPSGQMDTIEKYGKLHPGIQEQMLGLLDHPDLKKVVDRINAPQKIVEMHIEQMLEHSRPMQPLPFMDLEFARLEGNKALLQSYLDKVPEERQSLLISWLAKVDEMMAPDDQAAGPAPQGPPPGAAPGQPPGAPAMPPGAPAGPMPPM